MAGRTDQSLTAEKGRVLPCFARSKSPTQSGFHLFAWAWRRSSWVCVCSFPAKCLPLQKQRLQRASGRAVVSKTHVSRSDGAARLFKQEVYFFTFHSENAAEPRARVTAAIRCGIREPLLCICLYCPSRKPCASDNQPCRGRGVHRPGYTRWRPFARAYALRTEPARAGTFSREFSLTRFDHSCPEGVFMSCHDKWSGVCA